MQRTAGKCAVLWSTSRLWSRDRAVPTAAFEAAYRGVVDRSCDGTIGCLQSPVGAPQYQGAQLARTVWCGPVDCPEADVSWGLLVQQHCSDGEGSDDVAAEEEGVLHSAQRSGDRFVGVTGLADAEQPGGGAEGHVARHGRRANPRMRFSTTSAQISTLEVAIARA